MFKFRTTLTVSGFNQVRLLNKLSQSGVRLYRVSRSSPSEMRLTVRTKELGKAIAIIQNLCYTFESAEQPNFLTLLKKRAWVPLAALALTAAIFVSNMFIWRIDISGSSGLTLVNVQKLVSDSGLHTFSYKPDDLSMLESSILALDEVAAVSVGMSGNTLKINIIESGFTTPVERGGPVVSGYDAVVTRIVTESGSALVKRGEVVRRGQPLISGQLKATLDGALTVETQAKGEVYGTVTFMFSTVVQGGAVWSATGRTQTETTMDILGLEWKGGECEFECYRSTVEVNRFFCFTFKRTVYEELTAEAASADIDAYAAEKINELENVYGSGFEAKYIVESRGGIDTVKLYLSAELCLGQS